MKVNKNLFQTLWAKYNQLCQDLGVEQGACRGCVPVVKFDPEPEKPAETAKHASKADTDHPPR